MNIRSFLAPSAAVFSALLFLFTCPAYLSAQTPQDEPDPDEFVAVEREVVVDLAAIQKTIVYPEIARRAGIEGQVILRVLVGRDGRAKKYGMVQSSHEWFIKPAVEAVMKAEYVPALQNSQPIDMWITIPIIFKLAATESQSPTDHLISTLTKQAATDTDNQALHIYNRGLVYYKSGQPKKADSDYRSAKQWDASGNWKPYSEAGLDEILRIKIEENNAPSLTKRAELLSEYSIDRALADYEAAIRINPAYQPALEGSAVLYYRNNMFEQAISNAEKAVQLGGSTATTFALLGYSHYAAGNYAQAIRYIEDITRIHSDYPGILYLMALAKLRTGKPADDIRSNLQAAISTTDPGGEYRKWAIAELRKMSAEGFRTAEVNSLLQEVFGEQ